MPRSNIYRNIAYTFLALTILVVVSVLWLSSVRAKVTVYAKREIVKLDGTVSVARQVQPGQIPGRVLETSMTQTQAFDVPLATSTPPALVPSVPVVTSTAPTLSLPASDSGIARGTVRIINHYSRAQTLIKTTRLLTADQKLYRIERTVRILPGEAVSVAVHADQPGASYAIGPTRFIIPGLFVDLQKFIYAVSDTPFSSGTPTAAGKFSVPAPTPPVDLPITATSATPMAWHIVTSDVLNNAWQSATREVIDQAKKTFQAEINDPKLSDVVIFAQTTEPPSASAAIGERAPQVRVTVKLHIVAVYYPKADMLALIQSRLKDKIPDGRQFLPLDDNAVSYNLESADSRSETASIHVIADGNYRLTADSPSLQKEVIAGKSAAEALNLLKAIPGVQDVNISLSPSWIGKIPTLKDHIDINVQ